jgi:FtsZ-interacting cell division protein ZipA
MTIIITIVVIVLAILLIGLIVSMVRKRNAETNRAHAEQLRTEAATQAPTVSDSQRQAEAAEAQAQVARAEAERAELRANEAQQGAQVDQARQEDALREADRLDPDVDHRADDYRPTTPSMGSPVVDPADPVHETGPATTEGAHRSDGSTGTT